MWQKRHNISKNNIIVKGLIMICSTVSYMTNTEMKYFWGNLWYFFQDSFIKKKNYKTEFIKNRNRTIYTTVQKFGVSIFFFFFFKAMNSIIQQGYVKWIKKSDSKD